MTVYADSSFYERTYLSGRTAVIPSSEFGFYARRASNVLRQYTLGNIGGDVPDVFSEGFVHGGRDADAAGRGPL